MAMSEDLKARVEPALKTKEECQDDFEECQRSCDEAEVINGAKRVQGRDFEKKLPKRRRETPTQVSETLWNMSLFKGTKTKNLALSVEHGWRQQLHGVAHIWVAIGSPEAYK